MEIEKVSIDETTTWAYWENKFKGMSQEEIDEYWKEEAKQASSDESMLMDSADGAAGVRREIVNLNYQKYLAAKTKHEKNIENEQNSKEDSQR